ncbi:MAG: hypothetical protein ABI560_19015 [Myxococcales bacterium]
MNIEREMAQGGRSMEASQRQLRERAAVFVGRASFRMLPGPVEAESEYNPSAGSTPTPLPAVPQERWFAPSERVVLSPPESLAWDNPMKTQTAAQGTASLAATATSFGRGFEGTLDAERKSPHRRATPLGVIAAAIIVGATATLSAQAVMHRPARPLLSLNHATALVNSGGGQPVPARSTSGDVISATATATAPLAATPTVVLSTAPVAPSAAPADPATILKMVATSERPRPARAPGHPVARETNERGYIGGAARSAAESWIDPFVDEPAGLKQNLAARNGRAARATRRGKTPERFPTTSSTAQGQTTAAWVDPFVN